MLTSQQLRGQITRTQELRSVVSTMKGMAAASIRQYERAADALKNYLETIELGLRGIFRISPELLSHEAYKPEPHSGIIAVLIGSDQGLCGNFNGQVASYAMKHLPYENSNTKIIAIGYRLIDELLSENLDPEVKQNLPHAVDMIAPASRDTAIEIEQLQQQHLPSKVIVFYNSQTQGAAYEPHQRQLKPISANWLSSLHDSGWPNHGLPMAADRPGKLLSELVHQFLLVSLFDAFSSSLAAENISRLAAMQSAEDSISSKLEELQTIYWRQRQSAITGELLEIVAGYEVLAQNTEEQ